MIGPRGENLVFLASQPRSGSTLLQRVLGSHSRIATASEPWVMLSPLFALRDAEITATYNAQHGAKALRNFIGHSPGGMDDYDEGLRRMWTYLYGRVSEQNGPGRTHFLDKTPRYYLIIPELLRVFPAATMLVLLRNPLAVLCSLLNTWATNGSFWRLSRWQQDLFDAPRLLCDGARLAGARGVAIRYEEFLAEPEKNATRVCAAIGLQFEPAMIDYGSSELPAWEFGDKRTVYNRSRPEADSADRWTRDLADPQIWRLCDEYLRELGADTIRDMGYDFEKLRAILDSHKPSRVFGWTNSMKWLAAPASRFPLAKQAFIRASHLLRGGSRKRDLASDAG